MDDAEANKQISQMVNFILNEAKDKAEEIEAKALEDFNIEKLKLVQQMKEKIRQEYSRKAKAVETQRAIQRSTAINKSRLRKIAEREKYLDEIVVLSKTKLQDTVKNAREYQTFLTNLIVSSSLQLLEAHVTIRCKECDVKTVQGVLDNCKKLYGKVIREQAGVDKNINYAIDSTYLPKSITGGVVLFCHDSLIHIDNTIEQRLKLMIDADKPTIKKLLYPA